MPRPFHHPMLFTGLVRLILLLVFTVTARGAAKEDSSYILRPNDTISLSVYQELDLSVKVRILKTGEASFPLIGSVEVGGLSVAAAAAKIRDLYAKDYLVDPKLNLTVDEYATEFISVIGAVKIPGQIPMPVSGHLDLASAMATAGGLLENADANSIQLVRASGIDLHLQHGLPSKVPPAASNLRRGSHHRQPERLRRQNRHRARPGRQTRPRRLPAQGQAGSGQCDCLRRRPDRIGQPEKSHHQPQGHRHRSSISRSSRNAGIGRTSCNPTTSSPWRNACSDSASRGFTPPSNRSHPSPTRISSSYPCSRHTVHATKPKRWMIWKTMTSRMATSRARPARRK